LSGLLSLWVISNQDFLQQKSWWKGKGNYRIARILFNGSFTFWHCLNKIYDELNDDCPIS
jgi:hypothetical protein